MCSKLKLIRNLSRGNVQEIRLCVDKSMMKGQLMTYRIEHDEE